MAQDVSSNVWSCLLFKAKRSYRKSIRTNEASMNGIRGRADEIADVSTIEFKARLKEYGMKRIIEAESASRVR